MNVKKRQGPALNPSNGFTIIELIVVVVVIAILAAIIMLNVTAYISRSKDAKIKTDIANIAFGMSACYANTGTYADCITNKAYVSDKLLSDITKQGGTLVTTANPTSAYCAGSVLLNGGNVCVDSKGSTKTTACTTELTACP